MRRVLTKNGYEKEDVIQDGNRFLLGNGHLGYRGTLEEHDKDDLTGFILAGVYDQHEDDWRENLSLPNPLHFRVYQDDEEISLRTKAPLSHEVQLDIEKALFHRHTEFEPFTLSSTRLLSHDDDSLLLEEITLRANRGGTFRLEYGLDRDIADMHGPHFRETWVEIGANCILFHGKTNEGKPLHLRAYYEGIEGEYDGKTHFFSKTITLKEGEEDSLRIIAKVCEEDESTAFRNSGFEYLKSRSIQAFQKKLSAIAVEIDGDEELDFEMAYSIYHALILGDEKRVRSIAARGVSGQTYKGAVFWDTEIFLLPFYVLANPTIARNLLLYRINTLKGALTKAKSLGFEGAYYAWESQDSGREACRADNVTDPVTGETVITYFGTKQIHISADVAYAFDRYIEATGDASILEEGGTRVLLEIARFFLSYARADEDGVYHIDDVIGPDEYHERVDDEAFTLGMARRAQQVVLRRVDPEKLDEESRVLYHRIISAKWASPKEKEGIYEEFDGYFALEDVDVATLKKRVKNPQDYWGGKNGIATKTTVIKQADVIALLALCPEDYDLETVRKNYDYYFSRTEHGSSLSASMHSLLAVRLGRLEEAYDFLRASSGIDLRGANKLYAGGVYIGGTHPAANAGAYLGLIYGFLGFRQKQGKVTLDVHLPSHVRKVRFYFMNQGTRYEGLAYQDGHYEIKEAKQ